jgi:hypothetical protein
MLLYHSYLDSLSKCIYTQNSVWWFRRKTLDSVLEEKKYMFQKAYALDSIERSLTRIKSCHFVHHTNTHLRYTSKHNIDETFV